MIKRRRTSGILRGTVALGLAIIIPVGMILLIAPSHSDEPAHCTDDTIYLVAYSAPAYPDTFIYGLGSDDDKRSDPQPEHIDDAMLDAIERIIAEQALTIRDPNRLNRQPTLDTWTHLTTPPASLPTNTLTPAPGNTCNVSEPGVLWLVILGMIIFIWRHNGISQ